MKQDNKKLIRVDIIAKRFFLNEVDEAISRGSSLLQGFLFGLHMRGINVCTS